GTATSLPKAPTSPWVSFPMLFDAIRDKVPAKDMEVINMHYLDFKSKKMTRADLVKKLRVIVGDALLGATITGLQRKVLSS
ncbi:inactive poly (ADP-ribose) polymerase RCD1-like, partial [Trifolium medium]|nr:inactive poly (ADP-ribose) polymerase RCD1-like [Trifolium medium]